METSASLVNTITDNAVITITITHFSSHINQILPPRSHYALSPIDMLPQIL